MVEIVRPIRVIGKREKKITAKELPQGNGN